MKGKLIKLNVGIGYRLDDEHGNLLASTLNGSKNKLSFKNCEAIERGYNLDELAKEYWVDEYYNSHGSVLEMNDFKEGFKKAVKLLGDKKFSEEDMRTAFSYGMDVYAEPNDWDKLNPYQKLNKHIQSLQQTEWQVEVVMDRIPADLAPGGWDVFPKLDADGCLILKRIE